MLHGASTRFCASPCKPGRPPPTPLETSRSQVLKVLCNTGRRTSVKMSSWLAAPPPLPPNENRLRSPARFRLGSSEVAICQRLTPEHFGFVLALSRHRCSHRRLFNFTGHWPLFSPIMRPPSYRQRLFVEHYLGGSSGSAVDAARRTGYSTPHSAGVNMLRKATFK
jgi:hypothetical protein